LSEPAVLADTPEMERVRRLNLMFCRLQVDTLRTVLGSPYLTNLVSLELDSNALPAAVVGVLEAAMGNLTRLRELWLGGNRLGDEGARHLARSTAFGQLQVLDLSHNGLHPTGAVAFAESPRLTGLARLILKGHGRWPREFVRTLRDRFGDGVEL
jgi:hypothetical protein